MNHVIPHLAARMLNAKKEMERDRALAYQSIMEIRTLVADQNVFKIPIVIDPRRALEINAKIHVLAFVELMLNVEFKIILQFASV